MTGRVWVLNLEAEHELMGRSVAPLAAAARRPDLVDRLAETLVPPGDRIARDARERHDGWRGRPFGATPAALACLAAMGASAPPWASSVEVLARVSSRSFSAGLGLALPGARLARSLAEVEAQLASADPRDWLLRRIYGFAGKGRRVARGGRLGPADAAFVTKALTLGAVLVEPWVDVVLDCSLHGFVGSERDVLGHPTVSEIGPGGVWRTSRLEAGELSSAERAALAREASRAAAALREAGFRGPFGIDGFRFVDGAARGFVARSEINARYTMGWGVGMGATRPDLDG